jgi:hypothetical protein
MMKGKAVEALLDGTNCALEHENEHTAVDCIYQKFTHFDIIVPVCEKCMERLTMDDWILLFCVECTESKWIYKPESKHKDSYQTGEHVRWMPACPKCQIH